MTRACLQNHWARVCFLLKVAAADRETPTCTCVWVFSWVILEPRPRRVVAIYLPRSAWLSDLHLRDQPLLNTYRLTTITMSRPSLLPALRVWRPELMPPPTPALCPPSPGPPAKPRSPRLHCAALSSLKVSTFYRNVVFYSRCCEPFFIYV